MNGNRLKIALALTLLAALIFAPLLPGTPRAAAEGGEERALEPEERAQLLFIPDLFLQVYDQSLELLLEEAVGQDGLAEGKALYGLQLSTDASGAPAVVRISDTDFIAYSDASGGFTALFAAQDGASFAPMLVVRSEYAVEGGYAPPMAAFLLTVEMLSGDENLMIWHDVAQDGDAYESLYFHATYGMSGGVEALVLRPSDLLNEALGLAPAGQAAQPEAEELPPQSDAPAPIVLSTPAPQGPGEAEPAETAQEELPEAEAAPEAAAPQAGALPQLSLAPAEEAAVEPAASGPAASIGTYSGAFDVATSSHRVNNDRSISVAGDCALDGDLNTAWNTNDRTEGEWIEITVTDGKKYMIGGLRIANGYWKNGNVYRKNARMRSVDVYCDGEYVESFELSDAIDYQTLMFREPVECSSVMLKISAGYKGSTYRDCCVTEIDLIGPQGTVASSASVGDWGRAVGALSRRMSDRASLAQGDKGYAVVGLQLLLRDAFGALDGSVDGDFGSGTRKAVDGLAGEMERALGGEALPMIPGVVDENYWKNMLAYMDALT